MNAFEQLGASLLMRAGYWVYVNYKVELTPEDKKEIKRPSSPRWEVDLIAYQAKTNELLAVECKSYVDSGGVNSKHFEQSDNDRMKLFNDETLRRVVFERMVQQLVDAGSVLPDPKVRLALLAGNIKLADKPAIKAKFEANAWLLLDARWIRDRLGELSGRSYEDDVAALVAKLLLRPAS